jgi:hypothetical protein
MRRAVTTAGGSGLSICLPAAPSGSEHDRDENALDATYDEWDLISRNTQAVVSGIYLFSVEDKDTGENQVGKFVIIK